MPRSVILWICTYILVLSPVSFAKDWAEFTQDMTFIDGYVPVYYDKSQDKVFLQIERFSSPLLFQSSMPFGVGSNDIGLDRGQLGETRLVQFERFGNKVLLKQLNTQYRADSDNQAEKNSIDEAFADSVIAGFTIASEKDDKVLIDYTAFLLSDIHGIADRLTRIKQGTFKADPKRSGVYLPKTKGFEKNTELEALVTFGGTKPGNYVRQVAAEPKSLSVHLHHSFVELPDGNYTPRVFHPYSGFWRFGYYDYATPIDAALEKRYIPRHRLFKKDPTAAISEAVEPIVYYLDPGIPEPVMSALKDGAEWWNQAFTNIGYKDAFQVKVLPEGADPMDLRYNVINWVHRATRGWSYGSSVIDPRTGEIIKGHVTLGSLRVRQDYLIALGLTSPYSTDAADTSTQKDMALARIRQLSAHEVGHTLGIAHNFAASEDGRESVMDYPHPVARIVKNKIVLEDAYDVGMGEWDKHVIAYGYQDFGAQDEAVGLTALITQTWNKGLKYKSDPDTRSPIHPSADGHLWDNGSDPIDELERIAQVRQFALERFGLDTIPNGTPVSDLREILVPLYFAHRYQVEAVVKLVGGLEYSYETKLNGTAQGQSPVEAKRQQRAINALINTLSPDYLSISDELNQLLVPKAYGTQRTRESFNGRTGRMFDPVSAAEASSAQVISLLLHPHRLNRLSVQHAQNKNIPGSQQLIQTLLDSSMSYANKNDSLIPLRVTMVVIDGIMDSLLHDELSPENKMILTASMRKYTDKLKGKRRNPVFAGLYQHLMHFWNTGEWLGGFDAAKMPPGSPI